jgi:hypothetical protein
LIEEFFNQMDLTKTYIAIPLGFRCSAAYALAKTGLRTYSFPFDWCMMTPHSMSVLLNASSDSIRLHLTKIISNQSPKEVRSSKNHDWFPHDSFPEAFETYVRRVKRLHQFLRVEKDIQFLFVTTFGMFEEQNYHDFILIRQHTNKQLRSNPRLFFCVSATKKEYFQEDIKTWFLPLCVDPKEENAWKRYEERIALAIKRILHL